MERERPEPPPDEDDRSEDESGDLDDALADTFPASDPVAPQDPER